jgi:hypothetical protein
MRRRAGGALLLFLALSIATEGRAAVLYREGFDHGHSGWGIGPPAHTPYFSLGEDRIAFGAAPPSLRVTLDPATLNSYLVSPAIRIPRLDADYTISFGLRVEMPDSPCRVELILADTAGAWIERRTLLDLSGEDQDRIHPYRVSFHGPVRSGRGSCRLMFGLPYVKVFRQGSFCVDDVELREGTEAGPLEIYLSPTTVAAGETVDLHLSCGRESATVQVYREAERRIPIGSPIPIENLRQEPAPPEAWRNGCAWPVSATIPTARDWPSGVYIVRVDDGDRTAWAPFVVRGKGKDGRVLVVLPTHTDQAYNDWGGRSFYSSPPTPEVSFERPTPSSLYLAPIHLIRWLSAADIPYALATDDDLDQRPELLGSYPGVILTWHSEYWTRAMREGLEDYVAGGGSLISLSGNTCWWQTRTDRAGRLVCYKYDAAEDPILASDPALVTTHWDEPPLDDPPTHLLGLSWRHGGMVNWSTASSCPCAYDWLSGHGGYQAYRTDHWVFGGTGVQERAILGRDDAVVGYEVDGAPIEWVDGLPRARLEGGTPEDFQILGYAPCFNQYRPDSTGCALMGILERGRSFVFNGGTTGWCWGLVRDPVIQAMTLNLIERLPNERSDAMAVAPGRAFPNPAYDRITLEVPRDRRAGMLEIFAVDGRRVASLHAHREVTWDFRDAAGRLVPGGAYWAACAGRRVATIRRLR